MRISRVLAGAAAVGAVSSVVVVTGERRILRNLDANPTPDGWTRPRFPSDTQVMVPTDDGAQLVIGVAEPADTTPNETPPTVVLVHGLTSNHHDWGPVAQRLVDRGHRVVGVNQRGHGGSTVGSEGFGPQRLGADLGQVITALGLDNVTVAGHSMGGVTAMSLLTLCPETGADRVGRLVLISSLAHSGGANRRTALKVGNSQQYQNFANHPNHGPALARFAFGRAPSRILVDQALMSNRGCPLDTRHGAAAGLLNYDIRDLLPLITVPTVVICGDMDRLTSLRENRAIAAAIPGAQLVTVADAGHLVIWEAADTVADSIVAITRSSRLPASV